MPVVSPVSERTTVVCLLLLTFATGIVDAISVLVLGHVFVANMTGNIIFLGFWFAPHSVVDMTAALVAFVSFVTGAILGGRLSRHLDADVRRWLTVALGIEVAVLVTLSILSGTGVLDYHDNTKLILIAGLAVTFGSQSATARDETPSPPAANSTCSTPSRPVSSRATRRRTTDARSRPSSTRGLPV